MNKLLSLPAFAAVCLLSTTAFAQDLGSTSVRASVTPTSTERSGLAFGVSLGGGTLQADQDDTLASSIEGQSAAFSLRIGAALSPRALVQLDLMGVRSGEDRGVSSQLSFLGATGTGYVTDRVYLLLGLGVLRRSLIVDEEIVENSEPILGFLGGLGVDVYQGRSFGIGLETRVVSGHFGDGTGTGATVQLGFQWW